MEEKTGVSSLELLLREFEGEEKQMKENKAKVNETKKQSKKNKARKSRVKPVVKLFVCENCGVNEDKCQVIIEVYYVFTQHTI